MDIPTIVAESTAEELEALYKAIKLDEEQTGTNYIVTKNSIARHPSTPEHVLVEIHKTCTQPQIKLALLNNPNLPRAIVLSLCADKHPEVKKLASMRIKNKWTPGQDYIANNNNNTTTSMLVGANSSSVRNLDSGHKKQMFRRKAS